MTNLDSVLESRHINSANKGPYSQGYGFPVVMYDVRVKTVRKVSAEELMLLNCGVREDS